MANVLRIFIDFEFYHGPTKDQKEMTLLPISFGAKAVCYKGLIAHSKTLYLEFEDFDKDLDYEDNFLKEHVYPKLSGHPMAMTTQETFAKTFNEFFDSMSDWEYDSVEFYGYYCSFDHVLFCNLFGGFELLPPKYGWIFHDIASICIQKLGSQEKFDKWIEELKLLGKLNSLGEHNAFNDALWNYELFNALLIESIGLEKTPELKENTEEATSEYDVCCGSCHSNPCVCIDHKEQEEHMVDSPVHSFQDQKNAEAINDMYRFSVWLESNYESSKLKVGSKRWINLFHLYKQYYK